MPFVSKLWSHWPFWTSPSWKNAWRRLPVKLLRCLGSVYNPCSDHSFPFLWHSHAQWQVKQPGSQLQPWVIVGMDSSSGPHCVLYALQLITVSAQPFSEMFGTTKTVLAVCMRFFRTHKEHFVSDGTQLVDLTFRDDMPLTNIDQGRLPVYLCTPQHGKTFACQEQCHYLSRAHWRSQQVSCCMWHFVQSLNVCARACVCVCVCLCVCVTMNVNCPLADE